MTKEQEEALKRLEELRDSYELHQRRWANRCLDIIEDYVKNSVYKKMMEETEYLEEDKAIEKLKKYIENDNFYNTYKEVKEDKRKGKIGGTHIDFCKAIETVLSMLKENSAEIKQKNTELAEKNAEIEKFKQVLARNIARNVTSSMKESAKSKEDLEMLNAGWQIELEKKDKIIDLITEFLGEQDLGYYKNETGGEIFGIMRKYNKEDWKQYFENKLNSSEQN